MGRLVRRFIRAWNLTVVNQIFADKQLVIDTTGNLVPRRSRATIPTGVTLTGYVYGHHIELEITGTGVITGLWEGIRIELYAEAGVTLPSAMGIHISNSIAMSPVDYRFIRCSENGGALLTSCMLFTLGGASTATYFLDLIGAETCWNSGGAPGTQTGWIAVRVGNLARWIRLYSVAP